MSTEQTASTTSESRQDLEARSLKSAEMAAGIKAAMDPDPERRALTSFKGRLVAAIVCNLPGDKDILNCGTVRERCMNRLATFFLDAVDGPAVCVDMAAGFSTRGLALARQRPTDEVVEVDLPPVIDRKLRRLRRLGELPANLSWQRADLVQTPLGELLGGRRAHVALAEGLLIYLPPPRIEEVARSVLAALAPGGTFIGDVFSSGGFQIAEGRSGPVLKLVQKKAGSFHGRFDSTEDVRTLFERAGFEQVEVDDLAELAERLDLALPIPRGTLLVQARKAAATPTA